MLYIQRASSASFVSLAQQKELNIAKGTTDPGVDYFNQLLCLVLWVQFSRFGFVGLVW